MTFKKPINENYCGTVVEIKNLIPIENCDNVVHTSIFGNLVIVEKIVPIGTIGVYFPVETQLSGEFLYNNNLYRHSEKNKDPSLKGYFEDTGRIRAVAFRGNVSNGFFIPLNYFDYLGNIDFKVGDCFDEILGKQICQKYVVKNTPSQTKPGEGKRAKKQISRLVDNQFRFHIDTPQLGKNIHMIHPNDVIQCSRKFHGTSLVSSKVLAKRKLNLFEKALKFIGVKIQDTEYQNFYSSRKVIKNEFETSNFNSFYKTDIWGKANDLLKEHLENGMTIYAEIVGYVDEFKMIQDAYDYGCKPGEFKVYIYRITLTNNEGKVYEFTAKQVQEWCKQRGLNPVVELYYGTASNYYQAKSQSTWNDDLLKLLTIDYLEKDCVECIYHKVPDEGIVIRVEGLDLKVFKFKSWRFVKEETTGLDIGKENIEDTGE